MNVEEPYRTRYRYTDFFDLALAYNPGARNVLFIGLGAGSAEKRMWRDFPDVHITWSRSTRWSSTSRIGTSSCRATRAYA